MASDQKRDEVGKLPGKEDNPPQSSSRRASDDQFPSPRDPAYNQEPENLPSYEYNLPPSSHLLPTSTASSLGPPSQVPTLSPTQSAFPTSTPPPYTLSHYTHLLAIPQTSPHPTAPFLSSYAPTLRAHGIPSSTWLAFLTSLSTHLTARTSQRLLSHASDLSKNLGKDLLSTSTATGKNIARSAKQRNPVGVLESVVEFTFGVTGALMRVPGAAVGRSRTGVERVRELLEEVNRDWLHGRALHVELLGMSELAGRVAGTVEEVLGVAGGGDGRSAGDKMRRLRPWIGEVVVGTGDALEGHTKRVSDEIRGDAKDRRSFVRGAESVGLTATGSLSVEGPGEGISEGEASVQDPGLVLELGPETLWLVVSRWERGATA